MSSLIYNRSCGNDITTTLVLQKKLARGNQMHFCRRRGGVELLALTTFLLIGIFQVCGHRDLTSKTHALFPIRN